MAAMLVAKNKSISLLWEINSIFTACYFHVNSLRKKSIVLTLTWLPSHVVENQELSLRKIRNINAAFFSRPFYLFISLRKQPTFRDAKTGFPAKWRLENERRKSILMMCHFTTQVWVVLLLGRAARETCFHQSKVVFRHQYGISALVPQTPFRDETIGGVGKCWLLSQATIL